MLSRRGSLGLAAVGDTGLLAAGGFRGDVFVASCELYDCRADAWRPAPALSQGRAYGALAPAGDGGLLLLGGLNGEGHCGCGERWDPRAHTWALLPPARADPDVVLKRAFVAVATLDAD